LLAIVILLVSAANPTSAAAMARQNAFCSFCRKSYVDVGPLVEGPGEIFICGDCAALCRSIVEQEARHRRQSNSSQPQPSRLERLQQRLGACLDIHAKPISALLAAIDSHVESLSAGTTPARSLIVLVGPSSAAGLFVTKLIASALEAPSWMVDRQRLLRSARIFDGDSELFQILSSGEFDLEFVHRTIACVSQFDDRAVQEALGRMIHSGADDKSLIDLGLDPRKFLFVCGGAFSGLDQLAAQRGQPPNEIIDSRDLISWGVLPELVDRLHAAIWWDALDEQALFRIASSIEFDLPTQDAT
jgi:ATP-dependent Clp protease ATP-binding subunit ClpX